ncbi:MAG: type II toxin-antitoxin system PrlF family antitoxin [Gemmatimonadetes bacterium]|nr:type II toxin-antitoxin system PrlF family antitoxin [Gemmatimonadota bacterium]
MESSRLTTKYQATIPRKVREHLALAAGDRITFRFVRGRVVIEKTPPHDPSYLQALDGALSSEWSSKEDDEAYDDL